MKKTQLDEPAMIRELERAGYLVSVTRVGSEWRCTLHRGNLCSTHHGATSTAALRGAMVAAGLAN